MENPVLDIQNASIGYRTGKDTVTVACGINASLCGGELVALIGRNGAGKSTLLRTLSGHIRPLTGSVLYEGKEVQSLSIQELARKISVVLTDTSSVADMSVRELVSLGRIPYTNYIGTLTATDKDVVRRSMEIMGVEVFAGRNISTLSDGERQKCMIAKAFAQQTATILLDEPTAFLDYPSKVQFFRTLKRLATEENKAMIVSTHDLELALRLADKIWLMNNGALTEGNVKSLSESGALQNFIDDDSIVYNAQENRIEIRH